MCIFFFRVSFLQDAKAAYQQYEEISTKLSEWTLQFQIILQSTGEVNIKHLKVASSLINVSIHGAMCAMGNSLSSLHVHPYLQMTYFFLSSDDIPRPRQQPFRNRLESAERLESLLNNCPNG